MSDPTRPGGQEIHLLDYVRVLYKRRSTAITAFVAMLLTVVVYTFTATPIYEARTSLLIDAENPNIVDFKQVVDEAETRTDYYQTQYSLLQSRDLARRTLDALELWDQPPFGGEEPHGFSVTAAIGGALASVTSLFRAKSAAAAAADETVAQSAAVDRLLDDLSVNPVRNSRMVEVAFRSADPRRSAEVANALAKAYIQRNLEFKFMSSKEASDWLAGQLSEQKQKVEESEAALQRYREQSDAISLEDRQNIVVQKLSDLNAAVTRAKTVRLEKEALYTQLQTLEGDRSALDTFPAILSNTFIQQQKAELANLQRQQAQLSEKLGPNHPDMVRIRMAIEQSEAKLAGEVGKVVESVRNEYQAARAQEHSLMGALEAQKQEALAMNRKGITYGVLEREVESNRQIYESLLQRAKETGVSGELKTSNIRVVDAAEVPRTPASPRKGLALLLALFGGGTLAVGLAFFFEYLDNRIKTPDEIKAHLGLPFLGMIPRVGEGKTGESPMVTNGVPAGFAEAFRAVRTNVLFATAKEGARSIVVTSTGPGEGKTVVASNLAIGLAQAGQRVLLVDADLRRPRVHEVFKQKSEPGLSNLIVGTAKAGESVRKTPVAGLWVLPSGRIPPNPAELLGSTRFTAFLESLSTHFDWVVIDSPPVMAVTDASLVAHSATGVLFVVGAEIASRHGARVALEQLQASKARFFGAVLNGVNLEGNAYYYSQYYRREYARYYVGAR
jgi:capsular exopolysaccharide synthesis family protein